MKNILFIHNCDTKSKFFQYLKKPDLSGFSFHANYKVNQIYNCHTEDVI